MSVTTHGTTPAYYVPQPSLLADHRRDRAVADGHGRCVLDERRSRPGRT